MTDDCDFRLKNIEVNVEKIIDILNSNENGLVTKVALHGQKISDIPSPRSLKLYAFIGGGVSSIIAIISWALYGIFKSGTSWSVLYVKKTVELITPQVNMEKFVTIVCVK